jgi:homotetrameric cytidine deaminase
MRTPTPAELDLYARAQATIEHAYAPYSHFPVSAALQPAGGAAPILGVNVENASYGVTMCAERSALFAAVAMGHRRFETIAVHADAASCPPCGACRQALAEFGPDITVVYRRGGEVIAAAFDELLPERFEL